MNPVPTRKVKVKINLRYKPALKADSNACIMQSGLPPGVLAEQIVEIEIPINVSNAAIIHDSRFVLAVERARERLLDEMIDLKHEVITEHRT
jgi:hypothetical protein